MSSYYLTVASEKAIVLNCGLCYHSWGRQHVASRFAFLGSVPVVAGAAILDTIVAVGAGAASILTLGLHKPTAEFAKDFSVTTGGLISVPYGALLKTLNPEAKFYEKTYVGGDNGSGDGIFSGRVKDWFHRQGRGFRRSDNLLKRHIASRLTYLVAAVAAVVTRVIDGIIGILAAALSFIRFGKYENVNNVAFRGLQATAIIGDLMVNAMKFINPWAGADY